MVLHTKYRFGAMFQSFDGLIVEINAIHLHLTREGLVIHCKSMILGSDFDLTGFQIFHRLIGTAVAKFEFKRLCSECLAQYLVSKANPKGRQAVIHKLFHIAHGIIQGRRLTFRLSHLILV